MAVITRYDHFCDYQIKRFLLQLVRAFSGFQYETGQRGLIGPQKKLVPCTMAKRNRQVALIQRNLSDNVVNTVPMITLDQTGIQFDAERLQNPGHVASLQVHERKKDPLTGAYTGEKGNSYTVDRLMPLPFTITVQVDIWTSNMDQKHQLMEQILRIIFPTFDIQNSDNALDWSALSTVHCKDIQWSSVSVPIGAEDQIDIATINLELPMWLSPPAKLKQQKIIEQIITNINDGDYDDAGELINADTLSQHVTTYGMHHVKVERGIIKLLGPKANEVNADGAPYSWVDYFRGIKKDYVDAQTQFRLRFDLEGMEIVGTLQEGTSPSLLEWQIDIDSLPANTKGLVSAVIDPIRTFPGGGLPAAAAGQRYLLANDLPENSQVWGGTGAREGAIVQYIDGEWTVVFDGQPTETTEYVTNTHTGTQLRWTGTEWVLAIDGIHGPGYWRVI